MIIALFASLSPYASAMLSPALEVMAEEYAITNTALQQFMLAIFLLGYAIGSLIWSPLSEACGRVPMIQASNLLFCIFNLLCGFASTKVQILIFRFAAGLGGIGPLVIGGGVIGELHSKKDRATANAIYSVMPLLTPAIGPGKRSSIVL